MAPFRQCVTYKCVFVKNQVNEPQFYSNLAESKYNQVYSE